MAKYHICYENNVESNEIKQTDSIREAEEYIKAETKGAEYAGAGLPDNDRHHAFRYAVYDEERFTEESGDGEPVLATDYYWE